VSRQAYSAYLKASRKKDVIYTLVVDFVKLIRHVLPRIGGYKLWKLHQIIFTRNGHRPIGRDRFYLILLQAKLLLLPKKSNKPHVTYSKHNYAVKPNIIKALEVTHPNQVYVTDVTFILVNQCWYYLILVTDKYSKKIVGWEFSDRHTHAQVKQAVQRALSCNKSPNTIILHSDRGGEFCCQDLIEYLEENDVISSMTDEDHCAQNALAERMNGIIKQEFVPVGGFSDFSTARAAIRFAITLYNTARPHRSLGMRTPEEVHSNNYDNQGNRLTEHSNTKSAADVLEEMLGEKFLLNQIQPVALS
jgi:transposase InsO family protein